jgi:hypothetical protein
MLLDGDKNVLDSSIDIKGLRFERTGAMDVWSVWVQSKKLVCVASIDLSDCNTNAWWDVTAEVKQTLLDCEYWAGDNTGFWDTLERPLISYD